MDEANICSVLPHCLDKIMRRQEEFLVEYVDKVWDLFYDAMKY